MDASQKVSIFSSACRPLKKRRVDDTAKPKWAIYSPSQIVDSTLTKHLDRVNAIVIA
jgi:hypothetical protein